MASRLIPRVDGLGGECVAQLVGMDMADPGPLGDRRHVAMDGAPIERPPVVTLEEVPRARATTHGPVLVDEIDQHRQQGHVAVVVQFADRDAEAVTVTLADHGVVFESGELAHAHAGAGQQLDHEATAQVGIDRQGGHELGRRRVVQEPGQRLVEGREVAHVDEQTGRGVVVVPLDDALEEGAHRAEPMSDGHGGQGLAGPAPTGHQPGLEVLDVGTPDARHRRAAWIGLGDAWAKKRSVSSAAATVLGRAETSSWSR